ncbi:PqiC family protein [Pseudodonghicola flavimaris]|uniref:PqiC family protein n=1 Tax=Pseudodonghicola flavimaris TaxID=3050036 RepID=A0ABT7EW41_9RHOB|nr:PqiC family protein [Pseudodonghicola flavimaris]MDK3016569.1 PqiC family protein [Pseudodonghicola flavimaris]
MTRFAPFLLLALVACGDNDPRYLISAPAETGTAGQVALRVATLEVRQVSLPAYAAEDEILREDETGALKPVQGALWADTPPRAMTQLLADRIAARSRAQVAAEPWPLSTPAQALVDVRVSELAARLDGQMHLTGQFAISSPDQIVRERIAPFAIAVPLAGDTPAEIARATGRALEQLAEQVIATLRR